jgi:hypothetical protein
MKSRGTQIKKIKAVMKGNYANMVAEETKSRMNGAIYGFVGGVILGTLLKQNALMVGIAGAVIGYVISNNND